MPQDHLPSHARERISDSTLTIGIAGIVALVTVLDASIRLLLRLFG